MKKFTEEHRINMSISAKKRCATKQWKLWRKSIITPVDKKKFKELYYKKDMTQTEVANELGVSRKVIERFMERNKLPRRKAQIRANIKGEKHPNWKGKNVSYQSLHRRIYKMFGKPNKCDVCGTKEAKTYDWANLTGHYYDPKDYMRMCRSCHWKFDKKILNIKKMRK